MLACGQQFSRLLTHFNFAGWFYDPIHELKAYRWQGLEGGDLKGLGPRGLKKDVLECGVMENVIIDGVESKCRTQKVDIDEKIADDDDNGNDEEK